jgi:predicted nuclease of predicted toxin-antitoxin system
VKFLVDAQLPPRLARALIKAGHDAKHTIELPDGNHSSDTDVTVVADVEGRVVVSKDADFRISHQLRGRPRRLLIVAMGNVTNNDLLAAFDVHLEVIVAAFENADRVEIRENQIVAWTRKDSETNDT